VRDCDCRVSELKELARGANGIAKDLIRISHRIFGLGVVPTEHFLGQPGPRRDGGTNLPSEAT